MAKRKNISHMHWLVISLSVLCLVLAFMLFQSKISEAGKSAAGGQLSAGNCDTSKTPVINVNEKINNMVDSGEAGNIWALEDLNRNIQIWKQTDNTYCVLLKDQGQFDAQANQRSPGKTGILTGSENGTFNGGYRATITGAMKVNPEWATKGSVGTHDYKCNIQGNCKSYVNWIEQYFAPGYHFHYSWWGWTYSSKNHTWVNSSDGNSGDVL